MAPASGPIRQMVEQRPKRQPARGLRPQRQLLRARANRQALNRQARLRLIQPGLRRLLQPPLRKVQQAPQPLLQATRARPAPARPLPIKARVLPVLPRHLTRLLQVRQPAIRMLPPALLDRMKLPAGRVLPALLGPTTTPQGRSCRKRLLLFRCSDCWAWAHWYPVLLLASGNRN